MATAAAYGFLTELLIEIGYYYEYEGSSRMKFNPSSEDELRTDGHREQFHCACYKGDTPISSLQPHWRNRHSVLARRWVHGFVL
jgi:hypothetical protein